MEFRDIDYKKDIEEVVVLIRKNLQPTFTKDVLIWKHLNNPFGRSASIVAIENGKIVAVVFAMRYNFKNKTGETIKGIRTFDGCTDISQRGKGIFKKIMRLCVDKYKDDYDFLMANPNTASFPEHIKLGYVEPEQQYFYKFGLISPFGASNLKELKNLDDELASEEILCYQNYFLVGNTLRFIKWRYQNEAYTVKQYTKNNRTNYIVYRKEKKKKINTIILCDFYGDDTMVNEVIFNVCKTEKIFLIYFLDNKINKKINFILKRNHKKALVVMKLNNFTIPDNLVISLGDMEGRL